MYVVFFLSHWQEKAACNSCRTISADSHNHKYQSFTHNLFCEENILNILKKMQLLNQCPLIAISKKILIQNDKIFFYRRKNPPELQLTAGWLDKFISH